MSEMHYYSVECEVWVKPWFRKARPKIQHTTWAAHNLFELYRMLREHYQGKCWTLVLQHDITNRHTPEVGNERG